jgi:hypothetical protein
VLLLLLLRRLLLLLLLRRRRPSHPLQGLRFCTEGFI